MHKYKQVSELKYVGEPWVGVDLDGTLSYSDSNISPTHIGEPIDKMLTRVKRLIRSGRMVKIFTARVSPCFCQAANVDVAIVRNTIKDWCRKHIGHDLAVTCEKDHLMIELWDDISLRQVAKNTGYEKIKPPSA